MMQETLVTVFGGDGFVGRYVVQALLKAGARVRVASRNPKRGWFLKAQANLGQIAYCVADIRDRDAVTKAVSGADAVINLVGVFGSDMGAVHVEGARIVAAAAKAAGARSLVHVSAIGADPESPSRYGSSKGEGEEAVRKAFSGATIVRPSLVFGPEDQLTNRFAALIRMLPIVPVIGAKTRFQPVFVADLARAIAASAMAPGTHSGHIYEIGGPQILSMRALNEWIAGATGREKLFFDVPDFVASAMATLTGWLPGAPMTRDQWIMLQSDNVVGAGAEGLSAFDINPVPLGAVAPNWLILFRRHGRFSAEAKSS
jgi:uncharacterized protein YbjT (DUF2867 family)